MKIQYFLLFEQKISKNFKISENNTISVEAAKHCFFLHICDVEMGARFAPKIAKLVKITLEKHILG